MTPYRSLDKIVEQITFYISQLNSGKLSATEIDALLLEVQQLQERLIILRYKAFEASLDDSEQEAEALRMETPISFSMSPSPVIPDETSKQVSLIDVINEALENTPAATTDLSAVLAQASAISGKTAPEIMQEPVIMVQEEVITETEVSIEITQIPSVLQQSNGSSSKHTGDDVTLAERLQKSAIGDLSKAIPLGQKFVFINELFHQNADDYHASIDQLNKFDEMQEAMTFIKSHLMPLYNWKQDDKNVEVFIDLVERRFL